MIYFIVERRFACGYGFTRPNSVILQGRVWTATAFRSVFVRFQKHRTRCKALADFISQIIYSPESIRRAVARMMLCIIRTLGFRQPARCVPQSERGRVQPQLQLGRQQVERQQSFRASRLLSIVLPPFWREFHLQAFCATRRAAARPRLDVLKLRCTSYYRKPSSPTRCVREIW